MDEHTLNDLLECSVCLDRLDTSSKVLPCQHTFCRKCLEVIVSSRNELRCPECRVLVSIKIDDLPPNVLLMRILEGMKNVKTQQASEEAHKHISNDEDRHNLIKHQKQEKLLQQQQQHQHHQLQLKQQQQKYVQHQQQQQQQQQQLQSVLYQQQQQQQQQPPPHLHHHHSQQTQYYQQQQQQTRRCVLPHAYALFDFDSNESTDLKFKKGDLILLKRKIDVNWYVGQLAGVEGTFPINYVQVIVPLPSTQCIALYDFKMGPNEEEGCLTFKKGTVINVLRRVDHNWAEGRIGANIGIFPIAFVELNTLAKQLLDSFALPNSPPPVEPAVATAAAGDRTATTTTTTPSTAHQQPQLQQQQRPTTVPLQARNVPPIPLLDQKMLATTPLPHNNPCDTESPLSSSSSSQLTSPTSLTTTTSSSGSSSNCSSNCNSTAGSPNHSLPPQQVAAVPSGSSSVRYRNDREKRHSLNNLLTSAGGGGGNAPTLSIMLSNRHSAEILSVPHELSASSAAAPPSVATFPTATASTGTVTENTVLRSHVAPSEDGSHQQQQQQHQVLQHHQLQQQMHATRVNVLKTHSQQNVPPTLPWGYLALYPYKPRKSDELELKKGCVYVVTEHCLDGWFKGKNWQDYSGVFPGNYVTPLRARDQQQLMHQLKYVPQQSAASSAGGGVTPVAQPPLKATHQIERLGGGPSSAGNLSQQPPDLPPRQVSQNMAAGTLASYSSVWTKPLNQTVEAFFNRGKAENSTHANEQKDAAKDKEAKATKDSNNTTAPATTTCSSSAVSLMKRLTHIKSRSKSPNLQNATAAATACGLNTTSSLLDNLTFDEVPAPTEHPTKSTQLQAVHVRSGSCPSQLLQSLPTDLTAVQLGEQPQQASPQSTYGSKRIKGNKERTHLQSARQSMDGTLRVASNKSGLPPPPPVPAAQQQQNTISNVLFTKCSQQQQQPSQQLQQQQQHMPLQLNANPSIHSIYHRKSQSLDANTLMGPMASTTIAAPTSPTSPQHITAAAIAASATTKSTHASTRESRFRCVVPYPPNSDIELELHVGDIIYVQRKQKNGWYKGTHARTNKTGLFPASFVEPDI